MFYHNITLFHFVFDVKKIILRCFVLLPLDNLPEAELIGVDDALPKILYSLEFIRAQGYNVDHALLYQDNKSAILLDKSAILLDNLPCNSNKIALLLS